MKYIDALRIAQKVIAEMRPYCERVEVAGSLRRQKDDVKDIEIVAIPKARTVAHAKDGGGVLPLFPTEPPEYETRVENQLYDEWAMKTGMVKWIKPGTDVIVPWHVNADGKYWRGLITPEGGRAIKLDLFLCRPENWGVIYLIRTGSDDFSARFVTHVRDNTDYVVGGGGLRFKSNQSPILCPEERDVFDFAGIKYVVPRLRQSGRDVRPTGEREADEYRND